MLKDWITTCTKISVENFCAIDTRSYLISSQMTVPDEKEALELQLEQKLLPITMCHKLILKLPEHWKFKKLLDIHVLEVML